MEGRMAEREGALAGLAVKGKNRGIMKYESALPAGRHFPERDALGLDSQKQGPLSLC